MLELVSFHFFGKPFVRILDLLKGDKAVKVFS